jgi:hypothetical protein
MSSCLSFFSKNPQKWRPRFSNAPYGVFIKLVTADFDAVLKADCHFELLAIASDTVVLLTENAFKRGAFKQHAYGAPSSEVGRWDKQFARRSWTPTYDFLPCF